MVNKEKECLLQDVQSTSSFADRYTHNFKGRNSHSNASLNRKKRKCPFYKLNTLDTFRYVTLLINSMHNNFVSKFDMLSDLLIIFETVDWSLLKILSSISFLNTPWFWPFSSQLRFLFLPLYQSAISVLTTTPNTDAKNSNCLKYYLLAGISWAVLSMWYWLEFCAAWLSSAETEHSQWPLWIAWWCYG